MHVGISESFTVPQPALFKIARVDDFEICSCQGWTAAHIAAFGGHHDVVKLLLEKNATVDVYNEAGPVSQCGAVDLQRSSVVGFLGGSQGKLI